jgi:hypothetical protein
MEPLHQIERAEQQVKKFKLFVLASFSLRPNEEEHLHFHPFSVFYIYTCAVLGVSSLNRKRRCDSLTEVTEGDVLHHRHGLGNQPGEQNPKN